MYAVQNFRHAPMLTLGLFPTLADALDYARLKGFGDDAHIEEVGPADFDAARCSLRETKEELEETEEELRETKKELREAEEELRETKKELARIGGERDRQTEAR